MQRYIRLQITKQLWAQIENRNGLPKNSCYQADQFFGHRYYFGRTQATVTMPKGLWATVIMLISVTFGCYTVVKVDQKYNWKMVEMFGHARFGVLFEPFYR